MKINDWYVGIVEDVNDPDALGRVRVRALGYHTPDRTDLPTEDLPWATCISPVTNAAVGGVGTSVIGMVAGTWVFGFFRDGAELQDPVVLGTISSTSGYDVGYDVTGNIGYGDPHGLFSNHIGSDMPPSGAAGWSSANPIGGAAPIPGGANSTSFDPPPPNLGSVSSDAPARIVAVARSQIGITETSPNRGNGIQKFWSATTYPGGYGQHWCAAFTCWVIREAGILPEDQRPKSARARDFDAWGIGKPYANVRQNPRYVRAGDIVTFSWSHVGVAVTDSDANGVVKTVEGNTSVGGGREGCGEKTRRISQIKVATSIARPGSTAQLA